MPAASAEAVLATLRGVLVQEFEIAAEAVTLDARLVDDLDLDSVDAVSLTVRLEQDTGLRLEPDDVRSLDTVGSVVEALTARLGEKPDAGR